MGQPQLNQFTVLIALSDDEAEPTGVQYFDQEGCGHESKIFSMDTPMSDLVGYHEEHRVQSHAQKRRSRRCAHEAVEGHPMTQCKLREGHELASAPPEEYSPKHQIELTW